MEQPILIIGTLIAVLGVTIGWISYHWMVKKNINLLIRSIQQINSGNYSSRSGLVYHGSLFGKFAQKFDQMADLLMQREQEIQLARQDLESNSKRTQTILENMPVMLYALNDKKEIIFWNRECELVTGYSASELTHNPHAFELLYPDQDYRTMTQNQIEPCSVFRNLDRAITCKDGSSRTIAWSCICGEVSIPGWDTWLTGIDVTPRHETQFRLIESQRELSTLLSNLPGMAYRCENTPNWPMEFISQGADDLTGYPIDSFTKDRQITFQELIHPDDRDQVWQEVQQAVQERRPYLLVYRIRTAKGKIKTVWEKGRAISPEGVHPERLEGFITDISDRRAVEERLEKQLKRLDALRMIDIAIINTLDRSVVLNVVLEQVTQQLLTEAAAIFLLNPYTMMLEYAAGLGFRTDAISNMQFKVGVGFCGEIALNRQTIINQTLKDLLPQNHELADLEKERFLSFSATPLSAKGEVKGVMLLFHRSQPETDQEWERFLAALADQTAIAVDNSSLFNDLQRSNAELVEAYDQTIEGWANALELRDQETEGHSRRVVELTQLLATDMGIHGEELSSIRRGAILHDIGKMAIPDSILLKPARLSEGEWKIMRMHPVYAFRMLAPIQFLRQALDIPYCHHEHWDGSGYPRGLKGEQIPLAARIFAVVDVWDALLSERPYHHAWTEEDVRQYLKDETGSHFDPEVVNNYLKVLDRRQKPDDNPLPPA